MTFSWQLMPSSSTSFHSRTWRLVLCLEQAYWAAWVRTQTHMMLGLCLGRVDGTLGKIIWIFNHLDAWIEWVYFVWSCNVSLLPLMTTFHTSLSTPSYLTTFICNVIPHAWCTLLDWTCAHLVFKSPVSGPQKDQQLDQTDDQLQPDHSCGCPLWRLVFQGSTRSSFLASWAKNWT